MATSKHVFKIKTCRNVLKNHDLLSAISPFWYNKDCCCCHYVCILLVNFVAAKLFLQLTAEQFSLCQLKTVERDAIACVLW